MKTKCVICDKKDSKDSLVLNEWIINHKDAASYGKPYDVHSSCLNKVLKYESKEGFIYGKIKAKKDLDD